MTPRDPTLRRGWTIFLPAAALLLGGWRDPRLCALGGAAVWIAVWLERPALGPAAIWLPWLGWAALSGTLGLQPAAALAPVARWAAALAFFSVAAGWDGREREAWLKTIVPTTIVLAAAAFATGAGQGFKQRMSGLIPPYYNYTSFAVAGGVAAAAAWALHPRGARGRWRAVAWTAVALGLADMLAARSRGAVLGLLAAAWLWSVRRWRARAAAAGVLLLAALGLAWRAGLMPESVASATLKTYRGTPDERTRIWRIAAQTADESPLFGVGPGSFGPAFARRPIPEPGGMALWGQGSEYAHSELMQAAAETGWVGTALWLAAFVAALWGLAWSAAEEPAREAAAIAAAALGVQLFFDDMLQLPGLALLFFSAAAVSGARPDVRGRWPRAAAVAGIVLALAGGLPRALAERNPNLAARMFHEEAYPVEDLAYAAAGAGRIARADALWAEAQRRAPFDAVYPWRRAQIAAAQGRWPDAEGFAARAVALEPGFWSARLIRAEALARLGDRAAARVELAEIRRRVDARVVTPSWSAYESAVAYFDPAEFARVDELARRTE
jgi:O-antigen ligase